MTFGKIKTIVENNLIESYSNKNSFKRSLSQFKSNIMSNKNLAKLFNLYEQMSIPQGLSDSEAKEFLEEGIKVVQTILPKVKLPNTNNQKNNYSDIDNLVYLETTNIHERIDSKKRLIKILTTPKKQIVESVKIPISSMLKIANSTIENYLNNLDESSKKDVLKLLSEDEVLLKNEFFELKETTIKKLNIVSENETDEFTKKKISETIEKIQEEKFDHLNYVKLKDLEKSI